MYDLQRLTIAEMLNAQPELASTFVARKMACVGCPLARFCSLSDAARAYRVDLAELLDEIRTYPTRSNP